MSIVNLKRGEFKLRVTNKMLSNNFLSDMNKNLNNLRTLQLQMSSGKNFRKPSDDPFNVARSMQMHTDINANKQYNTNITNTINWLDTTDTALNQLNNVFQSVREKLIAAGNAPYGTDDRQKIKDEINQRVGQIAQILNTNFDGEYIFGGTKGASKPVDVTEDYVVKKSNINGVDISFSGTPTVSLNTMYKITVTAVDANGNVTGMSCDESTDGGTTWTPGAPTVTTNNLSIDGISVDFKPNPKTANGDTYSFSLIKNTELNYVSDKDTIMKDLPVVASSGFTAANWSGKGITFNVNGNSTGTNITLDFPAAPPPTVDDVVKNINSKINGNAALSGKIISQKTQDGKIKFNSLTDDSIWIAGTTVASDLSVPTGVLPNLQMDNIYSDRQTEISQGVLIKYNVSATDAINYQKKDGTKGDLRELLKNIVSDLDSSNSVDTEKLANEDLAEVDSAMAQILKVRSEVGAKQNRMDSAKDQNEQGNLDMTDILSKTEDIDITEKTMEYAAMQTVYLASLQTSAKVLQPTLMDYLR